jgi:hypothetical protein
MAGNRVLVILGMHRSGTSLTAQWLHACGLNLGDRLMGGGVGNVRGHFEDLDFHDLHEDVFKTNGVPYGGLKPVPPLSLSPSQFEEMTALVELKNSLNPQWGWKDPRTCLFLEHYLAILQSPTQPSFLVVFRGAAEVVDSMARRRKKEMRNRPAPANKPSDEESPARKKLESIVERAFARDSLDCWVQYNEKILEALDQLQPDRYLVTNYSDLMKNSESIFAWLIRNGFQLSFVPFQEIFDSGLMSTDPPVLTVDEDQGSRILAIESRFKALIEA